jgi:uncharacterized protein YndB with AHSA1/START domain
MNDHDRPATAEARIVIDAAAAQVWAALTDPSALRQYFMGAEIETDWQVGHPITFRGEWKGRSYEDRGDILEFVPRRELTFSHWSPLSGTVDEPANYHVVRIVLDDLGSRTAVHLSQSNLDGSVRDADIEQRHEFERNWSAVLDGLRRTVEGGEPVDGD